MNNNAKFYENVGQGPVNTVVKGVNMHPEIMGALSPEGGETQYHIHIDLADILRAMFEGVRQSQADTQKSVAVQRTAAPQLQQPLRTLAALPVGSYIGVYNYRGYGVFDDANSLAEKLKYMPGCVQGAFETYEEALAFAQEGIAELRDWLLEEIPVMRWSINWIQWVNEGGECND